MEIIDNESYVSLEIAKLLKKLKFDWKCNGLFYSQTGTYYILTKQYVAWNSNNDKYNKFNISAPTLEVAQKWLREIKHCFVNINVDVDDNECEDIIVVEPFTCNYIIEGFPYCNNSPGNDYIRDTHGNRKYFNTYEEAQEAGIKKILELILEKKNKTVTI